MRTALTLDRWDQAEAVLEFVRSRGVAHPREVDAAFQHGAARNWFGGNSRASVASGAARTACRHDPKRR